MWRMIENDRDAVKEKRLERGLVRRVMAYARPYRSMLVGFVVVIVLEALAGLAPPLLFKAIIDRALPQGDTTLLTWAALGVVFAAVAAAVLGVIERYWSSRVGEGLIFDLRTQLFDHVQRL